MGEIRFVGTGETRGYPYLVCKKSVYVSTWNFVGFIVSQFRYFLGFNTEVFPFSNDPKHLIESYEILLSDEILQ